MGISQLVLDAVEVFDTRPRLLQAGMELGTVRLAGPVAAASTCIGVYVGNGVPGS